MDSQELNKLASLARLKIEPSEQDALSASLQDVLKFIEHLDLAESEAIEPLAHPLDVFQRLRADQPDQPDQSQQIKTVAPHMQEGFYIVPKVID